MFNSRPFSPSLSAFQVRTIEGIAARPDFLKFVTTSDGFADPLFGSRGPVTVLWFREDQQLTATRVGRVRVLNEVSSGR